MTPPTAGNNHNPATIGGISDTSCKYCAIYKLRPLKGISPISIMINALRNGVWRKSVTSNKGASARFCRRTNNQQSPSPAAAVPAESA